MGKPSLSVEEPPPGLGLAEAKAKAGPSSGQGQKRHDLRVGQVRGEDVDQLQALLSSGI